MYHINPVFKTLSSAKGLGGWIKEAQYLCLNLCVPRIHSTDSSTTKYYRLGLIIGIEDGDRD